MRTAAAALAVVAATLAVPSLAAAHPRLLTLPSFAGKTIGTGSPRTVTIGFSEPVDPVGAGITVTGPTGAAAAVGPVRRSGNTLTRPIDAHARGTYVSNGWSSGATRILRVAPSSSVSASGPARHCPAATGSA